MVSGYPIFWKNMHRAIFLDSPPVNAPIREWMYVMNISELHQPTRFIVLSSSPASFSAMAPPALRLWDETQEGKYPRS